MASFDNEHTRTLAIALAAGTIAWFFQPQAVASVPQILGLVATAEPTQLNCADGTCSAAFSSFCLQSDRATPSSGTHYRVATGGEVTLVYVDAEGVTREVHAMPHVTIDSERSYAAVRISLPETILDRLGATVIALRVGEHVSAVPAQIADDRSPFTIAEIKRVTGELRRMAEHLFDRESDAAVAAAAALKQLNTGSQTDAETLWRVHNENITQANLRVWSGLEGARS